MKKNSRLPPKERKKQLEEFVIKATANHGISRVTHSQVAKLAGVSVSTVHFYFKRRQDLVMSATSQVEEYLIGIFSENLDQKSVQGALTDLAAAFLKTGIEDPDLIKVWLDWSTAIREKVWRDYQTLQEELHRRVRNVLSRAKREKVLPQDFNTMAAARIYIGTGHTLQLMIFDGASKQELLKAQKHLLRSVFLVR